MSDGPRTILIVDDEPSNVESLQRIFQREGYRTLVAHHAQAALAQLREHPVDVVLTDLMMPAMSGTELVRAMKTVVPEVPAVVMTAFGTVETAVEAMREGAFDFVEKPLKRVHIVKAIHHACNHLQLIRENHVLKRQLTSLRWGAIVGDSPALRRTLDIAAQAADSDATILVLGESGTGKELLARFIHERSGRPGPFTTVNVATLPEGVVESELFGHEKGAFTGAESARLGRVRQAEGGTLFLDEVGELSPHLQVKLLRLIQEGEVEPVGGSTTRVNVRILAATNRDLTHMVDKGTFREDLFYRLNVITITCPPLRERKQDVPMLVEHFIARQHQKRGDGGQPLVVDPMAMDALVGYPWPGNVRQLQNVVERAVILNKTSTLHYDDLPDEIKRAPTSHPTPALTFPLGMPLDEIERRVIQATLDHTGGDKQHAAQLLGISARTIYRRLDSDPGST